MADEQTQPPVQDTTGTGTADGTAGNKVTAAEPDAADPTQPKAQVGSAVQYFPHRVGLFNSTGPHAALVTQVSDDGNTISAHVFNNGIGGMHFVADVPHASIASEQSIKWDFIPQAAQPLNTE